MAAQVREDLLAAGLAIFERDGFEGATVAAIRARARASNGSFFHFFASKKELAGTLFLETLQRYHAAILSKVQPGLSAREGHRPSDPRASCLGRRSQARGALSLRNFARRLDRGIARQAARAQWAFCRRHRALARAAGRTRRAVAAHAGHLRQPGDRSGTDLLPRLSFRARTRRPAAARRSAGCLRHPRPRR